MTKNIIGFVIGTTMFVTGFIVETLPAIEWLLFAGGIAIFFVFSMRLTFNIK